MNSDSDSMGWISPNLSFLPRIISVNMGVRNVDTRLLISGGTVTLVPIIPPWSLVKSRFCKILPE